VPVTNSDEIDSLVSVVAHNVFWNSMSKEIWCSVWYSEF